MKVVKKINPMEIKQALRPEIKRDKDVRIEELENLVKKLISYIEYKEEL